VSSRKRRKRRPRPAPAPAPATPAKAVRAKPVRRQIEDQRPPAPWGSFPLVELVVAFALVLIVVGFFLVDGSRGTELLGTGLAIGSLAGLELSIREHLGGYRSHSLLLAGAGGLVTVLGLYYLAGLPPSVCLLGGIASFALGFWGLARVFQRRSGRLVKLR
jgi:hypothetical protein